jgi:hypothetical protein
MTRRVPESREDSPEFLPFPDDLNDGLVPVGLEIANLQVADFGLS